MHLTHRQILNLQNCKSTYISPNAYIIIMLLLVHTLIVLGVRATPPHLDANSWRNQCKKWTILSHSPQTTWEVQSLQRKVCKSGTYSKAFACHSPPLPSSRGQQQLLFCSYRMLLLLLPDAGVGASISMPASARIPLKLASRVSGNKTPNQLTHDECFHEIQSIWYIPQI